MRPSFIFFLLVSCFFSYGQKNGPLYGKWKMIQVFENENDVSQNHNPKSNRFIIFKEDGTFESGGDPYGENTGKYFYDPTSNRLMLDSDAGTGDDSMWLIEFQSEELHWKGIGSEWAERFRIVYQKVENK